MNEIPGISVSFDNIFNNPTLVSPNSVYTLPFYETRETLFDTESYEAFLHNALSRFRNSETYRHYKAFLMDIGLNRCQFMGNITSDMTTLEMHHNMLTIFDIAIIITEHILNTVGYISTFDLVMLLKKEHKEHHIQLVMLSKTPHQLYHNNDNFFIHPNMCIGDWMTFLKEYSTGITQDIAYKLVFNINQAIQKQGSDDGGLLLARDQIMSWNNYNSYFR